MEIYSLQVGLADSSCPSAFFATSVRNGGYALLSVEELTRLGIILNIIVKVSKLLLLTIVNNSQRISLICMDISMFRLALERSRTALEAVELMGELATRYRTRVQ